MLWGLLTSPVLYGCTSEISCCTTQLSPRPPAVSKSVLSYLSLNRCYRTFYRNFQGSKEVQGPPPWSLRGTLHFFYRNFQGSPPSVAL
jgi:hypothetical protein